MLNYKIYYMSAFEKCAYFLLVFVVGGLVGWVFYGGLFKVDGEATNVTFISNVVIFALFGLVAVRIFLPAVTEMLKTRRDKALRMQFRDMLAQYAAISPEIKPQFWGIEEYPAQMRNFTLVYVSIYV